MALEKIGAVVLAAGEGTRMNSELPKVLHKVNGIPMVKHVVDILEKAGIREIAVVVGYRGDLVKRVLANHHPQPLRYVFQKKRLGTAHAVLCAKTLFDDLDAIVVIYGDTPLFTPQTIKNLVEIYKKKKPALVLVSFDIDDPTGYGRVVSDKRGHVSKIVEEKDATEKEKKISEVNAGLYCFKAHFLWSNLSQVKKSKISGEYYLTDLIGIAVAQGKKVIRYKIKDSSEALGVNTPSQLKRAHEIMVNRTKR